MKKILLLASVVLFTLTSNAQEKSKGLQGVWFAGGQLQFGSTKTGDVKSTSNTILPIVGNFVSPSVAIGCGVGVINSTDTNALGVKTSDASTFVVEPLVRKYWNVAGNLYFYGQAALPITSGKEKISDAKTSSVALQFSPGFDYIVNKWMTVETSFTVVSVGSSTSTPAVGDKTTTFGFNANPFDLNPQSKDAAGNLAARSLGGLTLGVKFLF
ncbi:hypothetical protein OX284_014125 [Flavobacterium sp. SUN046]|uniref:hypothetical protein n=1 Tax=Flavobacterium sp. SUN046 TaxID=3002440 RepID=UPI002DB9C1E3|nr:hypothetical protein [Flavobacterium sp. SUN046]MEC4050573.1 hypothetical protein [Flavobacterium sp. SUN046]